MPEIPFHVNGSLDFMAKTDCHPWLNAIISPNKNGEAKVGIMNSTAYPITIPRNCLYGTARLVCSVEEQHRFPWRVGSIFLEDQIQKIKEKPKLEDSEGESAEFMKGPTTNANRELRIEFIRRTFKLNESPKLETEELKLRACLLYTSPSPRDATLSRMPSSA